VKEKPFLRKGGRGLSRAARRFAGCTILVIGKRLPSLGEGSGKAAPGRKGNRKVTVVRKNSRKRRELARRPGSQSGSSYLPGDERRPLHSILAPPCAGKKAFAVRGLSCQGLSSG